MVKELKSISMQIGEKNELATEMEKRLDISLEKLREEERKRQDMEAQLRMERKDWEATKTDLQEHLDKVLLFIFRLYYKSFAIQSI